MNAQANFEALTKAAAEIGATVKPTLGDIADHSVVSVDVTFANGCTRQITVSGYDGIRYRKNSYSRSRWYSDVSIPNIVKHLRELEIIAADIQKFIDARAVEEKREAAALAQAQETAGFFAAALDAALKGLDNGHRRVRFQNQPDGTWNGATYTDNGEVLGYNLEYSSPTLNSRFACRTVEDAVHIIGKLDEARQFADTSWAR